MLCHVSQMRSASISAKLTKSARWLFSQTHLGCLRWTRGTNSLCLSHSPFGPTFLQLGSRRNGRISHREKSSSRRAGSVMSLFDKVLLERHRMLRRSRRRSSVKGRTKPASGDCGIQTLQLHETFLCGRRERVSGRSLMVLSSKTYRF